MQVREEIRGNGQEPQATKTEKAFALTATKYSTFRIILLRKPKCTSRQRISQVEGHSRHMD